MASLDDDDEADMKTKMALREHPQIIITPSIHLASPSASEAEDGEDSANHKESSFDEDDHHHGTTIECPEAVCLDLLVLGKDKNGLSPSPVVPKESPGHFEVTNLKKETILARDVRRYFKR